MLKQLVFCMLFTGLLCACSPGTKKNEGSETPMESDSSATSNADSDWEMLFDGTSTDKWRTYLSDSLNADWKIEDNALTMTEGGSGDIITKDTYKNFEMELDWKISEGGNSGLFFNVVEDDSLPTVYYSGPEYQLLDNERHADAKIRKHRAGDNYDVQQSSVETVKPAGEWNHTKLIVNNGHVEHYLNGEKVVEYDLWTEAWEDSVANSKFAKFPAYGKAKEGHIALQDHGDQVWFKDIKIKRL